MYAIIETGGKQYKVSEGDVIKVEKLGVEAGDEVICQSFTFCDRIQRVNCEEVFTCTQLLKLVVSSTK